MRAAKNTATMGKKTAMQIGEAKAELKAQIIEQALKKVEQVLKTL